MQVDGTGSRSVGGSPASVGSIHSGLEFPGRLMTNFTDYLPVICNYLPTKSSQSRAGKTQVFKENF